MQTEKNIQYCTCNMNNFNVQSVLCTNFHFQCTECSVQTIFLKTLWISSLFLMLLDLEKDLFPEQLVTIKLRNSLNTASILEKAMGIFSLHII